MTWRARNFKGAAPSKQPSWIFTPRVSIVQKSQLQPSSLEAKVRLRTTFIYIMPTLQMLSFLIFVIPLNAGASCKDWFDQSGLSPSDRNCSLKCMTTSVDMATFTCHDECEKLCKPPPPCPAKPEWKKKFRTGRPKNWDPEAEVPWTEKEKKRLLDIWARLPDDLANTSAQGIFRLRKSTGFSAPGTTSEDFKSIVLYDAAFDPKAPYELEEVFTHELAHVLWGTLTNQQRTSYRNALGWRRKAPDSPFESTVPKAFRRIKETFPKLKLKKDCPQ